MSKVELIRSIGCVLRQLDLLGEKPATDGLTARTLKEMRTILAKQQLELAINQIEPDDATLRRAMATLEAIKGEPSRTISETAQEAVLLEALPRAVKAIGELVESDRYYARPT